MDTIEVAADMEWLVGAIAVRRPLNGFVLGRIADGRAVPFVIRALRRPVRR